MPERNNTELAKLKRNLAKDQHQQERKNTLVEDIRVQLEKIAKESVVKYQREIEATRPEAQLVIEHIVQPWFSNLVSSGTYEGLLTWCRSHKEGIHLSDTIIYYWPENAFKALAKGSNRFYLDTARFIVERYRGHDLQRGIQVHADGDEVWYAGFELETLDKGESEGLKIWRQPVVGMGFGFAMIARDYEIPVDAQNITASLDKISPEVWIKFGQQIESGKVWEVIKRSMKPRKIRVATLEETQRHRDDNKRRTKEYLEQREWH